MTAETKKMYSFSPPEIHCVRDYASVLDDVITHARQLIEKETEEIREIEDAIWISKGGCTTCHGRRVIRAPSDRPGYTWPHFPPCPDCASHAPPSVGSPFGCRPIRCEVDLGLGIDYDPIELSDLWRIRLQKIKFTLKEVQDELDDILQLKPTTLDTDVIVISGRRVPRGTVGAVRFVRHDKFAKFESYIGITTKTGNKHALRARHCSPVLPENYFKEFFEPKIVELLNLLAELDSR